MIFDSHCFWAAKEIDAPEDYQDAFAVDALNGIAAIADGVASAMFSGMWARILVDAVVREEPSLEDGVAFADWLARQRRQWQQTINPASLSYFQRRKLEQGAYSTLLWLRITPGDQDQCRWTSVSIGDCCLFHVRAGSVLRSFPLQNSAELDLDPMSIGSIARNRDHLLEFRADEGDCQAGDWFVLATDALAGWFLKRLEAGIHVPWADYAHETPENWLAEVQRRRAPAEGMRHDDTTLVMLRVGVTNLPALESSTPARKTLPATEETDTPDSARDDIAPATHPDAILSENVSKELNFTQTPTPEIDENWDYLAAELGAVLADEPTLKPDTVEIPPDATTRISDDE